MNKKLILDILMFIFMILEFSHSYMDSIYHEIIGIILFILFIIHMIFNKNYFISIFKGNINVLMFIVNSLFLISFLLTIVFGVLSSQDVLVFLNIKSLIILKLHKNFAYISLLFLGIHLGINFKTVFSKLNKYFNKKVLLIIDIIIVLVGVYSFIDLDIINHLIGKYGFSVIKGNIIINILEFFSIVMMISIIVNKLLVKKVK